jgi:hypothetical protein
MIKIRLSEPERVKEPRTLDAKLGKLLLYH